MLSFVCLYSCFIMPCSERVFSLEPIHLFLSWRAKTRYLLLAKNVSVDRRSRVKRGMTKVGAGCSWIILSLAIPVPLKNKKANRLIMTNLSPEPIRSCLSSRAWCGISDCKSLLMSIGDGGSSLPWQALEKGYSSVILSWIATWDKNTINAFLFFISKRFI